MLDDIIDGAVDDAVSTSSIVRKVQVVARRLEATAIESWARNELRGYAQDATLPEYRSDIRTLVTGHWVALNYQMNQMLSADGLPEEAVELLFRAELRQSLGEIETLSQPEEGATASIPWTTHSVGLWNQMVSRGLVVGYQGASLLSARQMLTPGALRGVLDTVRNVGMEFALELQAANPSAGSKEGPTVEDAPIGRVVWNVTNNLYGDGSVVAQGENIRQRTTVRTGDLASLLEAAGALGLSEEGKEELARVVLSDGPRRQGKVQRFLAKVGNGAFQVGTSVTTTQLSALISSYFGS
ncbi:hypothetical protein AB1K56_03355 [Microbacterium sp. BWR-S6Y]|uniref:AbiTii domain-containing protein n=1 Tax=Microbacterium sp. BWR-S6Y TaxID=3232073 RepID=UPI00352844F9